MTLDELLAEPERMNCDLCQGRSLPVEPGQSGYCPKCGGNGYIVTTKYYALTDRQRVEVLETEVLRLRPDELKGWRK